MPRVARALRLPWLMQGVAVAGAAVWVAQSSPTIRQHLERRVTSPTAARGPKNTRSATPGRGSPGEPMYGIRDPRARLVGVWVALDPTRPTVFWPDGKYGPREPATCSSWTADASAIELPCCFSERRIRYRFRGDTLYLEEVAHRRRSFEWLAQGMAQHQRGFGAGGPSPSSPFFSDAD